MLRTSNIKDRLNILTFSSISKHHSRKSSLALPSLMAPWAAVWMDFITRKILSGWACLIILSIASAAAKPLTSPAPVPAFMVVYSTSRVSSNREWKVFWTPLTVLKIRLWYKRERVSKLSGWQHHLLAYAILCMKYRVSYCPLYRLMIDCISAACLSRRESKGCPTCCKFLDLLAKHRPKGPKGPIDSLETQYDLHIWPTPTHLSRESSRVKKWVVYLPKVSAREFASSDLSMFENNSFMCFANALIDIFLIRYA